MTVAGHISRTWPGGVDVVLDADGLALLGLQVGDQAIVETAAGDVAVGRVKPTGAIEVFISPISKNIRVRRPRP